MQRYLKILTWFSLCLELMTFRFCFAQRDIRSPIMYPKGGSYKFNIGMSFPVDQPKRLLSFSMNFQFQYSLPRNFTELREYPEIDRRSMHKRVNRSASYDALETVMTRHGIDGRSCLLRSICEIAETPVYYNGLIGELLHIVLTPGYAQNTEEGLPNEYHMARRIGEEGRDCQVAYPTCPWGHGLLDLVSLIDF